ncbi:hypothetical protein [Microbacterium gorillae]|uniref:hypothetical protein n=1 Tax=Microbacterium gorillae TaxID=1231063 RepID=UPI00058E2DDC|nr:hypothetical protein [Microbacterium gorillae]
MVTLLLDSAHLEVALSATERAAAFHRDAIRVRRDHIVRVQLTDDPWTWLRGVRKPGTIIPNVLAAGTWHSIAGTDFVVVRGRRPGVVIDLSEQAPYQRLLLTTRHGVTLVEALRLDADEQAVPIDDMVAADTERRTGAIRTRPRPATA